MSDPRLRDDAYCGCGEPDAPAAPRGVFNRAGLPQIAWRIGAFAGFRADALRRLSETLPQLATREGDDHAITLVELWAAMADVLGFYHERIANEAFLRTATDRESLRRLVRLLDYRPFAGLSAATPLAFTLAPGATLTIRPGIKLMSVPGQDETPQVFETQETIEAEARLNRVPIDGPPVANNALAPGGRGGLLWSGPERVATRDRVVLFAGALAGGAEEREIAAASDTKHGRRVTWDRPVAAFGMNTAVKAVRSLRLFGWNAPATQMVFDPGAKSGTTWTRLPGWSQVTLSPSWPDAEGWVPLDARHDDLRVGALILLHLPGPGGVITVFSGGFGLVTLGQTAATFRVTEIAQRSVTVGPLSDTVTAVKLTPAPPAGIDWTYPSGAALTGGIGARNARLWEIEEPALRFRLWDVPATVAGAQVVARLAELDSLPAKRRVILTDGRTSHLATVTGAAPIPVIGLIGTTVEASSLLRIDVDPPLPAPLDPATAVLLGNVAEAGHGETQTEEILGNGDAARPLQRFTLRKTPLTRRPAADALRGKAALTVLVDDEAWAEAPTLFERPADAKVYALEQQDDGRTAIQFGDGTSGARLPSGAGNVRARYAIGLGRAGNVRADQLSILLTRPPGLREAVNPLPAAGGADPEDATEMRVRAPHHVRTFGRAVSLDDLAAIAVESGLVAQARADWIWSGTQRVVHLTVVGPEGDPVPEATVATLTAILAAARDTTRRVLIGAAILVPVQVVGTVFIQDTFLRETVMERVRAALVALLSPAERVIAAAVHLSDVQAAAQAVRGVAGIDVDALRLRGQAGWTLAQRRARDLAPGALQTALRLFPARPAVSAAADPVVAAAFPDGPPRLLPAEIAVTEQADLVLTPSGGIA
ncbi:baseplate J/gp47 family protein [Elioraea sp.]|uniref:baseplate J/gp47 family protein n=1 Tax=Elioraea sp. TaxID=2185103 RepID=UPI003F72FF49